MLTILGIKVSYETLVFFGLFIASEALAVSPLKENSIVQLLRNAVNALKPLRREDEQIEKVKDIFRG